MIPVHVGYDDVLHRGRIVKQGGKLGAGFCRGLEHGLDHSETGIGQTGGEFQTDTVVIVEIGRPEPPA